MKMGSVWRNRFGMCDMCEIKTDLSYFIVEA